MVAVAGGARLAWRRLSGRSTLLITIGAVAFATLAAWGERQVDAIQAADFALQGAGFGLAIPFAALSLVTVALSRARLQEAVGTLALLGASRRAAAIGALAGTAIVTAAVGLLVAATTAFIAHGQVTGDTISDAWTAAWIGGLSGAAYATYFGAASSFGKHGGGRIIALILDLVLGPLAGTAAVVFPRAHALNLLGASPVLDLPQPASTGILLAMLAVFGGAAALRTAR